MPWFFEALNSWSTGQREREARHGDSCAVCRICAIDGKKIIFSIKGGAASIGTKHYETIESGKGSETRRKDYRQAAVYSSENAKGGPRTLAAGPDGTITQLMRPTQCRAHLVRLTMTLVMTDAEHTLAREKYKRAFLDGFRIKYTPPALGPAAHHVTKLALCVRASSQCSCDWVKAFYKGVRWAQVSTDIRTARHSHESCGSVVMG